MNKKEVIEFLEKKRETALDNFEYYRDKENEKYEKMNRARVDSYTLAIQAVEKMGEAEKVEVTEEQAELLKRCEGESIYYLLGECTEEEEELLVKARLFGYTVKPKRWVIKNTDGDTCYLKRFRIGEDCTDGESSGWIGERVWAFTFDDKSKAEAVAVLVEGSVEEV